MSTATQSAGNSASQQRTARPVNLMRVIRSEFIKFRSLRTTWILLAVTVVVMIGFAAIMALGAVQSMGSGQEMPSSLIPMIAVQGGGGFAQLIIASFGAVFMATEYSTGMIRSTMTAAPNRWSPIVAKAIVLAVVSFIVGVVSVFPAFFAAQPILAQKDLDFSITTDGVIGSMIGFSLYLALVAFLGMSIGALLRNAAGSIVTVIGLLFVVPLTVELIPLDFFDDILPYLPDQAGFQTSEIDTSGDTLNQWQGGLVCLAWAMVAHIVAIVLAKIRDV